jgi:hypothetical protein
MKKILLMSIPHTGTIFVSRFLEQVMGVKLVQDYNEFMETGDTNVFLRLHTSTPVQTYKTPIWEYAAANCKTVSPLRHPYENAVSCFAREHSNLAFPWACWNSMMETAPLFDEIFWVDIDTQHRENMMNQLCEFIEREPRNLELYERYIKDWKKVNRVPKHNKIRKAYNETKELPNGPRYDLLDDAVVWYDNIKEQIDKQYAPGEGSQAGLLIQPF